MMTFMLAYWPVLSIVLILMLFGVFFLIPGWAGLTAAIVLSLSLAMTIFSIVQKHKNLYREKPASKIKWVCNIVLEIMGILMAMILAGWLARSMAPITTQSISNEVIRIAASIGTGLLVGLGASLVMQHIWGRFIKNSADH
jgi:hypothetical protein